MSKKPPFPPTRREVLIVIFPDFQLLDAAGPIGAFEIAARISPSAYRIRVAAIGGGLVPSSSGIGMPAEDLCGMRLTQIDTLIAVGGQGTRAAMADAKMLAVVQRAPASVRRVTSVCSGAFLLAAAGLLDGKHATTHWRQAPALARLFPAIIVEADRIHIKDGGIWTSAGVSAGIDLALAMIGEDLGENIATQVAREMVVHAKRPGGQAQHSALLELGARDARFAKLNAWVSSHLGDDLSVERLAREAAMSPRNFARAYAAATGVTPAKAVERLRLEAARAGLEQGGAIQEIARRCGFGDPERMRRAFIRFYGAPPASMRRTLRRA